MTLTATDLLSYWRAAPVGWWSDDDVWHPSRIKDVDGDGYLDVVATFEIADLQLTTVVLKGSSKTTRFTLAAPVTVSPARQAVEKLRLSVSGNRVRVLFTAIGC